MSILIAIATVWGWLGVVIAATVFLAVYGRGILIFLACSAGFTYLLVSMGWTQ